MSAARHRRENVHELVGFATLLNSHEKHATRRKRRAFRHAKKKFHTNLQATREEPVRCTSENDEPNDV